MQAFEEININRRDIQQALAGQMDALERILTIPQEQLNQATAKFLLDEVTPVFLNSPENHCAITLAGYARSKFKPINATPTELAQSLELALQYYEQATKMGNALAMCCAANCYVKAEGTKQDLIKAAKYFRNALKILSNNQSIKIAFTAMMRRFECPNEALYDYWITEEISDVSEQIKKRLLQNK